MPQLGYRQTISQVTIYCWMYKLGFRPQEYQKSIYFDGHERLDVVKSRTQFLSDVAELRKQSRVYVGTDLENSAQVNPNLSGDSRETVFVDHNESTVHAKERPKLLWLLPGVTELRSKNKGRLINISDFIIETTGRLIINPKHVEEMQLKGLAHEIPTVTDAAVVIYPGANGDKWWDMDQLIDQVKKRTLPIFEALHPHSQGVFVFDCSSAHEAYGPAALRVQNMNFHSKGKQGLLRDTIIPSDDPNIPPELHGTTQTMVFPAHHPDLELAGKPKGIKVVLQERGLWKYNMRNKRT